MRLRVLLCGTNYGRFYLDAIRMGQETYTLAGILARGGQRSRELATNAGVPLFQSVSDAIDCDMACFVIGSSGSNLISDLLMRGIHVLCEHPRSVDDLAKAMRAAVQNHVCFHMNGHFGDLPGPKTFIARVGEYGPPVHLSVTATDRSLYGALDIIGRALGKLDFCTFGSPVRSGPFACAFGVLGGIPTALKIQDGYVANAERLTDSSPNYLIDFQIVAVYPDGTLSLLSLAGPVVWNRNYNRAAANEMLWTGSEVAQPLTPRELKSARILANLDAIDRLAQHINGASSPDEQRPEYILQVAEVWESLCRYLKEC